MEIVHKFHMENLCIILEIIVQLFLDIFGRSKEKVLSRQSGENIIKY